MVDTLTSEDFFASRWGVLATISSLNLLLALLCIAVVGLTRLSIIPIIATSTSAIADALHWYNANSLVYDRTIVAAVALEQVGWIIRELSPLFYSYFILWAILQNRKRHVFLVVFWFLFVVIFILRIVSHTGSVIFFVNSNLPHPNPALEEWKRAVSRLSPTIWSLTAAIEITSAAFLIYTFNQARKAALNGASLFRQLLLSSEIRVATLASIGIIRAGVATSQAANIGPANDVASHVDFVGVLLQEMFPVLLIFDQLATRAAKLETTVNRFVGNVADMGERPRRSSARAVGQEKPSGNRIYSIQRDSGPYLEAKPAFIARKRLCVSCTCVDIESVETDGGSREAV